MFNQRTSLIGRHSSGCRFQRKRTAVVTCIAFLLASGSWGGGISDAIAAAGKPASSTPNESSKKRDVLPSVDDQLTEERAVASTAVSAVTQSDPSSSDRVVDEPEAARITTDTDERSEPKIDQAETPRVDAAPLSVAPLSHIRYPKTRPRWIDDEVSSDSDYQTFAISSGPCESEDEAKERVAIMTLASIRNQIEDCVDEMDVTCDPEQVEIDPEWVESELVIRRYSGPVDSGGQPQFEAANLIQIDKDARQSLRSAVEERVTAERVAGVVVAAGLGFSGLLGCSFLLGALHTRQRVKRAAPANSAVR